MKQLNYFPWPVPLLYRKMENKEKKNFKKADNKE